jgi:hypothetical protein
LDAAPSAGALGLLDSVRTFSLDMMGWREQGTRQDLRRAGAGQRASGDDSVVPTRSFALPTLQRTRLRRGSQTSLNRFVSLEYGSQPDLACQGAHTVLVIAS